MARKLIFEVRYRGLLDSRSLGFFTDDFLARQAVNRLYEDLWQSVQRGDPGLEDIAAQIKAVGWEQWSVQDKTSVLPTFFILPHNLYNSVPSNVQNFTFVEGEDVTPF